MIRRWGGDPKGFIRDRTLVVYCAHDAVYADQILQEFQLRSGIKVSARYDTEATKSLGLTELIVREKDAPRCDVFWNNEMLGTADLAERGLLEPYRGDGWQRIPDQWKDAEARWTGFAARMRVVIVNTKSGVSAPDPTLASGSLERVAIAKPLYGTTLTHYVVLWHQWGAERLKAWHRETRSRGLREVNGNGAVKQIVAQGTCDSGLTDTDDYFDAKDAGGAVRMLPVQLDDGATICIPNTVAIVRGSRHGEAAQKLVDFLLSAETEEALARSKARQIPLGTGVAQGSIPTEVRELAAFLPKATPLKSLLPARAECLGWLKAEYTE